MTLQQFNIKANHIRQLLKRDRIYSALSELEAVVGDDRVFGEIVPQIQSVSETYSYIVKYALAGTEDPTRHQMISYVKARIDTILSGMLRLLKAVDSPALYYSTLRTLRHRHEYDKLDELLNRYKEKSSVYSMALLSDPSGSSQESMRIEKELEGLEERIFATVWTKYPLDSSDKSVLADFFKSSARTSGKVVALGAVGIGLLEVFDIRRIEILLDIYESGEPQVSARALTLLLMMLTMIENQENLIPLSSRFHILSENAKWRSDVVAVFRQFLNSRDTDRVSRKMSNEIFPTIQKLGKDFQSIAAKFNPDADTPPEDMEGLEKLLNDSEFGDKMREMNELQEQGADIMLATFGHLKQFPFFRKLSNWFLPYHSGRSEVVESIRGIDSLAELLENASGLCDNDKYSMVLSMGSIPDGQRDMLKQQIVAQSEQLAELQLAAGNPGDMETKSIVGNYARSMFRFFKFFDRKNEFVNPFDTPMNLLDVKVLAPSLNAGDVERQAADFYFSHGYYSEALPLYLKLEDSVSESAAAGLYFNIGDCYMHMENYAQALTYFERSELYRESKIVTLRLAMLHRASGNHKRAVEYLQRAINDDPKHPRQLELTLAAELIELGRYAEASDIFYKEEYLNGLNDGNRRMLAFAELMRGNTDKARSAIKGVKHRTSSDSIMLAAMDFSDGNISEAADRIEMAISMDGWLPETVVERLEPYRALLYNNGVDRSVVEIAIDEALRRIKK